MGFALKAVIGLKVLHIFIVRLKNYMKETLHEIFLKEDLPGEKEGMRQLNHSNCSTLFASEANDLPSHLLKPLHVAVGQELDWILKERSRTYCCFFTFLKPSTGTCF